MRLFVTGGAGFIGSNYVHHVLASTDHAVTVYDALTYAGNLDNLRDLDGDARLTFTKGDIGDRDAVMAVMDGHDVVVHFAAESHVDRSIHGPSTFVQTNVNGTFELLEAARGHWQKLSGDDKAAFRFLHVSTDEVYGSLAESDPPFSETTPYAPNSPYSASKAASDHRVRAWHHTYGLPTLTTNCSNNYGPFQFPEKLIPLMISNALEGKPLPVYGDGRQVRDWLYVGDHCAAIRTVLERGRTGEVYNVGGDSERRNLDVVHALCDALQAARPREGGYRALIQFVADRPGHDRRYAIDARKIRGELGWKPRESFESGLARTVRWYLEHAAWVAQVKSGEYRQWLEVNYAARSVA